MTPVQELLHHGHSQRLLAAAQTHDQTLGMGDDADGILGTVFVHDDAFLVAVFRRAQQHLGTGGAEHHPVHRLKDDGRAVDVAHLGQAVPGGVVFPLLGGQLGLDLLPAGLGGGQAVVAVSHHHSHGGLAGKIGVALVKAGLAAQVGHGGGEFFHQSGVL